MSGLPEGWVSTKIGEICNLINGKAFKPEDWGDEGLPIVRIQNLNRPKSTFNFYAGPVQEKFLIDNQDLLFAWSGTPGTSFGAHIWSGGRAVLNQHIFKVEFDEDLLDRVFLKHAINQTLDEQIAKSHGGVGLRHVTKGKFEDTNLSLPPLPEQKRIVAKVGGLTARTARARADLDRIPTLIARYKQRLLALAFSGELTEGWRVLHELPGPKEVTLSDVAKGFAYGSSAKSEKTGDVPVLRMGNIQQGKLDWSDLVFTSDSAEIKKYTLSVGDVLFNRTNSPELVGKTALYRGERPAIYAGYLIRIQCSPKLLPEFLTYCLNGPAGREYCWSVKTDGVSQSNINAKKIAAFRFLLPSLEEQAEIVRQIDSAFAWLDRVASDHAAAAKFLPKLDAAILAKAFRGELVPQNPNDEPAGVLLERIKAQRGSLPKPVRIVAPVMPKATGPSTVGPDELGWHSESARLPTMRLNVGVSAMTKSRQDEDVMGKPYLANLLKAGHGASAQDLFKAADLPVADFYKQLAWEIASKHIRDDDEKLEAL